MSTPTELIAGRIARHLAKPLRCANCGTYFQRGTGANFDAACDAECAAELATSEAW